jgi:hypothetical protein
MPFGRGFGFRGWSPPWPYVGRGRGGLPRCWAYGANWVASYADPSSIGGYPYPFPEDWRLFGVNYPLYSQFYPEYPQAMGTWGRGYESSPYESQMMTPEREREWLKNQTESIRQEIDQIKDRISELEKE